MLKIKHEMINSQSCTSLMCVNIDQHSVIPGLQEHTTTLTPYC